VWCFDLLHLDGRDLRDKPLGMRRAALHAFFDGYRGMRLRESESFDDATALLAACERRGLEGIVCKRLDAPYRSGRSTSWLKIKSAAWRARNPERYKFFER
jgi:bifunctional non-homologous end joining protein LigD